MKSASEQVAAAFVLQGAIFEERDPVLRLKLAVEAISAAYKAGIDDAHEIADKAIERVMAMARTGVHPTKAAALTCNCDHGEPCGVPVVASEGRCTACRANCS